MAVQKNDEMMKNGATTFGKTTAIITTISVNGLECDGNVECFIFVVIVECGIFFIVLLNAVYADCRGTNKNTLAYAGVGYSHLLIEGASLWLTLWVAWRVSMNKNDFYN
jgi:hypothetical protein